MFVLLQRSLTMAVSRTWRLWAQMIRRCECKKDPSYHHYGGRGIRVCKEWRESFEAFIADVGERPSLKHKLERENNDGNYEPGNVVWATQREQTRNQRRTRWITFNDKTQSMVAWAEEIGISYFMLRKRLYDGWTVEAALTTPVLNARTRKPPTRTTLTYQGRSQAIAAWAREFNMPQTLLSRRLREGWPIEKAVSIPKSHGGGRKRLLDRST
jgi:hypothetical protein